MAIVKAKSSQPGGEDRQLPVRADEALGRGVCGECMISSPNKYLMQPIHRNVKCYF